MKPASKWNEDDILALPPGENDTFERKGAKLLDLTIPGVREDDVLNELAKQLSAFANTGGGKVIYGVTDAGTVDNGGVARFLKGRQSTKAWLEDVIPTLTDFEIVGCNVYGILPKAGDSTIASDKSLYVVDVPDSDRAPHQSKRDWLYYVRLGGMSQPASHRLIEDIRNRSRHPSIVVSRINIELVRLPDERLPRLAGTLNVRLRIGLRNERQMQARTTCLYIEFQRGATLTNYDNEQVRLRRPGGTHAIFYELMDPIYPEMEVAFWLDLAVPATFEFTPPPPIVRRLWTFGPHEAGDVKFRWRLYADNAPVKEGRDSLLGIGFEGAAQHAIDIHPDTLRIRRFYGYDRLAMIPAGLTASGGCRILGDEA